MSGCPFCDIVNGAPATMVGQWPDVIAFVPLNPVVRGHVLFVPRVHVEDYAEDPTVTGATAVAAARYAKQWGGQSNLITSRGPDATQSIKHLHLHVVPRYPGDGLTLPWSPS